MNRHVLEQTVARVNRPVGVRPPFGDEPFEERGDSTLDRREGRNELTVERTNKRWPGSVG